MDRRKRDNSLRWSLVVALFLCGVAALGTWGGGWAVTPAPAAAAGPINDDAGDELATTSFDGPMVRQRAAIGILPVKGADRRQIARELRASAKKGGYGELSDATFAVFNAGLLEHMVPELTLVLPEGASVGDADRFMRDYQPATVGFYVVQPVLVHDLTFAVVPASGVTPAKVQAVEDAEGILADSLNHYVTTVQPAGLTVRYFGAILSDGQIETVRQAMGRAAQVPAERVAVEANEAGPGVDMSHGAPDLTVHVGGHH
ncbi:hypothetical protein [Krasilnikovia sp. MM14-A1004]|uniref:hypothetical protein n=1 Tax=Krasilnikovia sp. MM14-A1004 TaxID=3373541 RepID=UPI00399CA7FF